MCLNRIILLAFVLITSSTLIAQELPIAPEVRIGRLDNGLTYYICPNKRTTQQASFYLVQRVGSLQEEEYQRGLAHFVEHMCFNGSEHFPGHESQAFLERHKMNKEFFNAATDIANTIYHIDNVPTDVGEMVLDSCLLLLSDWCHGLTLDEDEVTSESKVIHEEWRVRNKGFMRMIWSSLPQLMEGSPMAKCLPIGKLEVIDNCTSQQLREYYEKWYNPENQAVVVTGDIDPDHTEAMIRQYFASLQTSPKAGKVSACYLPDFAEPRFIIDADDEAETTQHSLGWKLADVPYDQRNSVNYLAQRLCEDLVMYMMNKRLELWNDKPDCNFIRAKLKYHNLFDQDYLHMADISFDCKGNDIAAAYQQLFEQARQAAEFGFTPGEFALAQSWQQHDLQDAMKEEKSNDDWAYDCCQNFLTGQYLMNYEMTCSIALQIAEQIPLEMVNDYARRTLYSPDGANLVVSSLTRKNDVVPTREQLAQAFAQSQQAQLCAYEFDFEVKPLMEVLPTPGTIVSEKSSYAGFTEWTLSNGLRLYVRSTDEYPNTIALDAVAPGGLSLLDGDNSILVALSDGFFSMSKKGGYTDAEIEQPTAGQRRSTLFKFAPHATQIQASATPASLETLLQYLYLSFTALTPNYEAFESRRASFCDQLANVDQMPSVLFGQAYAALLFAHPEWTALPSSSWCEALDYEQFLRAHQTLMADAGAFCFTLAGDLDLEVLRPLVCQYLASLPGTSSAKWTENRSHTRSLLELNQQGGKRQLTLPIQIPQDQVSVRWVLSQPENTVEEIAQNTLLMMMLSDKVMTVVREQMGVAYTPEVSDANQNDFCSMNSLGIEFSSMLSPGTSAVVIQAVDSLINELAEHCDAQHLQASKEAYGTLIKQATTNEQLCDLQLASIRMGVDFYAELQASLERQTPASIEQYAKRLLIDGRRFELVMNGVGE